MQVICLHAKEDIEDLLRRNVYLHLYALGDLDDFFWPYTTWYALSDGRRLGQVALLYTGAALPVLLGLADKPLDEMRALLRGILHLLPRRLYAHLSHNLTTVFEEDYHVDSHGPHYKMALMDRSCVQHVDTSSAVHLSTQDLPQLETLYRESYPGNSFDARMLETGLFYGVREGPDLVCAAGVHVYSPLYRVAALGNVTTHPRARGKGWATVASARVCQALMSTVDHIGLNVKADNRSALACYERLGFQRIAEYEECFLELKHVYGSIRPQGDQDISM